MSRAICKTCTKGFDYPTRRGRPPGTCPACLQQFSEAKAEHQAVKEKKLIQRAENVQRYSSFEYPSDEAWNRELDQRARKSYEDCRNRLADILTLPTWEDYCAGHLG